ncbi:LVIVD repeat-containing protein [Spongiimicrobium salis]|uniref:hypothetical protein n=1 Tax=Spongiimicrobium salis TaxID=1667022 RepID=UPI00374DF4C6
MNKFPLLVVALLLLVSSCSDETTVFNETQDDLQLQPSQQALANSVNFDDAGVLDLLNEETINGTGLSSKTPEELANGYPLTLVAQIDPPSFSGGENLTASHVHIDGNYAYVSYNTVEDGYAGGADIIDISDPNNPVLRSRLNFNNADVNAIRFDNGFAYVVGGFNSELSPTIENNSFVGKIEASGGFFNINAGVPFGFQEGFVGTDIKTTANEVLVTSGKDGVLAAYRKSDLTLVNTYSFADLRSLAIDGDKIAVLDASVGVNILDGNYDIAREIPINADFGIASKRTMDFFENRVIVSEGANGAGVYDYNTGDFLERIPILVNPADVAQSDIVTNAISANGDVVFMANGGAGLCVTENDDNNAMDVVGILELNGSINYVESKGDYLFAASGKAGLQIIKLNRPSASLVERCISLPLYNRGRNLTVEEDEDLAYTGSARFSELDIKGALLLCGSWTVRNDVDISANALFEMNGTFVVGRNRDRKNIIVDNGATFRVEGNLTIFGDLILNDGATLEFLGDSSVVNVIGDVIRNGNTTVTGTFDDVANKF